MARSGRGRQAFCTRSSQRASALAPQFYAGSGRAGVTRSRSQSGRPHLPTLRRTSPAPCTTWGVAAVPTIKGKLMLALSLLAVAVIGASTANAMTLPDDRAYELVTPPDKNGASISPAVTAPDGNAVNWVGIGGCCGAKTGGEELYQSTRGSDGWTTTGLSPTPSHSLESLFEIQAPVFWTPDLSKTIYDTVETYDPTDTDFGTLNLYLSSGSGKPVWLSQGSVSGGSPSPVTFDGATPDANVVAFSTEEQLTPDATGLDTSLRPAPEYLYVRDVATASTKLIDVTNAGTIPDEDGAALGNGGYLGRGEGLFGGVNPPNVQGTTTNAISSDGDKVFFESPPYGLESVQPSPSSHLYMRDLTSQTTTALDDPSAAGFARYEGASQDGSLVFFTSTEGLGGDPNTDLELYEFNTTTHPIGAAPPMSVIPLSAGNSGEAPRDGQVVGASAIANDGSHVYFVAEGVLSTAPNGLGDTAALGKPNLYVFDTVTGQTAFVASLAATDASERGRPGLLTLEPDVSRPAVPTPDGSVLAFMSSGNLTGGNPPAPSTTLAVASPEWSETITVESTAGLRAGRHIEVGTGSSAESAEIKSILNGTEIALGSPLRPSYEAGTVVQELNLTEVYRYSAESGSLVCISCVPSGVQPNGAAFLGGGGGSYAPPGQGATMNSDGSRIFFMSQDQLLPEDENHIVPDVYEWENGELHLISDGESERGGLLFGTTPTGNDVFFTTAAQLVPQDTDAALDTYDARVGGGFSPASSPSACSGSGCRGPQPQGPSLLVPGSATLPSEEEPVSSTSPPVFRVAKITMAQRRTLARTGLITLNVSTTARGRITARAFAALHAMPRLVASTTVSFASGSKAMTLHLSQGARASLARHRKLALKIELRYSATDQVRVIHLTLALGAHPRPSPHRAHPSSLGLLALHLPSTDRPGLLP
jgi:hypothetical protein